MELRNAPSKLFFKRNLKIYLLTRLVNIMNFSDALLDQAGGRVWSLLGGVWVGVLGCHGPGCLWHGGGWQFLVVLRAGKGVGSGCTSAVGFILCGCAQTLTPDMPSGPLWVAGHSGILDCWGLWVPWGSHLGFSILR